MSPSYTRGYPLVMAGGQGAVVEDVDGNRFLDCAAGIAVNATGHSHPEVVKAIVDQAQRFLHMSGTDFYYEPQVRLAEEMSSIAPMEGPVRSFFGNSGTEAVEASLKLAKWYTKRHEHHRVPRLVPWPHDGVAVADVEQGAAAARLRPDAAGRVPRTVRELLPVSREPAPGDVLRRVRGCHRAADPRPPRLAR